MRESLNSLAVIVLVIFYCFATDIIGNSPKFYGIDDKPAGNIVSFIQTIHTNSFFYLTQKENSVSEPIKLPVTQVKKLSGPCLCSINMAINLFKPTEKRFSRELNFPMVSSKIFLIIFPFNYYW